MGQVIWAQMRHNAGRLIAAGLAIAIGAAFVAATMLATQVVRGVGVETATARLGNPDLVVVAGSAPLTEEDLAAISSLELVRAVNPDVEHYVFASAGGSSEMLMATLVSTAPELAGYEVIDGEVPRAPGEIVLPAATAERLGSGIGSQLELSVPYADEETGEWVTQETDVRVVGIAADGSGLGFATPLAIVHPSAVANPAAGRAEYWQAGVLLVNRVMPEPMIEQIERAVPGADVMTREERGLQLASELTGETDVLSAFVMAFAALSLLVAALVITNTFSVLVAQRARTLALLRCVGARRGQVRAAVLAEAAALGVLASSAGVVGGVALTQASLAVLRAQGTDVPLPAWAPVTFAAVAVPIAVGTLVTVLAALSPARIATRVAPLAALRPLETRDGARPGLARLVMGTSLVLIGVAALGYGLLSEGSGYGTRLLSGMAGGALSLVGVLMVSVVVVPAVLRVVSTPVRRLGGVPGELAAENALRNPRRSAATASALVIGVTLVTMTATGAALTQRALSDLLDAQFPVDVGVYASDPAGLTPAQIAASQVEGVGEELALVQNAAGEVASDTATAQVTLRGIDPDDAAQVARPGGWSGSLTEGVVLLGAATAAELGVGSGDDVEVSGEAGGLVLGLEAVVTEGYDGIATVTAQAMDQLTEQAPVAEAWLSLAPGADPIAVTAAVNEALVALGDQDGQEGSAPYVSGAVIERAGYEQVIDTALAVVLSLLAVAVLIALIGIANTLALSVIERRRELGLLRALGLSRRLVGRTVRLEGALVALVGAVIGIVLGIGYGWAGVYLLLEMEPQEFSPVIPWGAIGALLVVSVVAGVLAATAPARRAARISPVVALAVD